MCQRARTVTLYLHLLLHLLFLHTAYNQFIVPLSLLTRPRRSRQSPLHSPSIPSVLSKSIDTRTKQRYSRVNLRLLQQLGLQGSISLVTTVHEHSRATVASTLSAPCPNTAGLLQHYPCQHHARTQQGYCSINLVSTVHEHSRATAASTLSALCTNTAGLLQH